MMNNNCVLGFCYAGALLLATIRIAQGASAANPNLQATQLLVGTELFQDTLYSRPVLPNHEPNTHTVVEGGRNRLKVQTNAALEAQFLDHNSHYGVPELIQLEITAKGQWELVHYRYPWGPREDGLQADGLVRDVIMNQTNGLTSPMGVYSITDTHTNEFGPAPNAGTVVNRMNYALFVQQSNGNPHYTVFGAGSVELDVCPGTNATGSSAYPVRWTQFEMAGLGFLGTVQYVDTYTSPSWNTDQVAGIYGEYKARNGVQHIIVYLEKGVAILSLLGDTTHLNDGAPNLATMESFYYPNGNAKARVINLSWSPDSSSSIYLQNIVLMSSTFSGNNNQNVEYKTYTMSSSSGDPMPLYKVFDSVIHFGGFTYPKRTTTWQTVSSSFSGVGDMAINVSGMTSVQSLYTLTRTDPRGLHTIFHVKLANLEDRIMALVLNEYSTGEFELAGAFPMQFPDTQGLGQIVQFSGGTSKFGGMRFSALDSDGNLFLMRQRGIQSSASAEYHQPIYGLFNGQGVPLKNPLDLLSLPNTTSPNSNLHHIWEWVRVTGGSTVSVSLLQQVGLAFGTDASNMAQGLWLGSGYKSAITPQRMAYDSIHVLVKETATTNQQNPTTTTSYTSFVEYKDPITKMWHKHPLGSQFLPSAASAYETADFYHATVKFGNAHGLKVPPLVPANQNFMVEVRAEAPTNVQDVTSGFHHYIDRYTSFMTTPDKNTGEISLTAKADSFSKVLYMRLVDKAGLQHSQDAATLIVSDHSQSSPWQKIDLAQQAQQRMSNTPSTTNAVPPTQSSSFVQHPDTNVYISEQSLSKANQQKPWSFKGKFAASSQTFSTVSKFLTTSAGMMVSLNNVSNPVLLDPLTALTYFPQNHFAAGSKSLTTSFDYENGIVQSFENSTTLASPFPAESLGNIFDDIAHAFNDAVHWVENNADVQKLKNAVIEVVHHPGSLLCLINVSPEIMKMVSGISQALKFVTKTLNEFGKFVAHIVSSITNFEHFLIELIMALLSLFLYLGDIKSLHASFAQKFSSVFSQHLQNNVQPQPQQGQQGSASPPPLNAQPTTFFKDLGTKYLGVGNQMSNSLNHAPSDKIPSSIHNALDPNMMGWINELLKNPFIRKIWNKILSSISTLIPIQTNLGHSDSLSNMGQTVMDLGLTILKDLALDSGESLGLVGDLSSGSYNPKQQFGDLKHSLGHVLEGFLDDVIGPALDFMDHTTNTPTGYTTTHSNSSSTTAAASGMIDYNQILFENPNLVTISDKGLGDFFHLIGLGNHASGSGFELVVSGKDAVFFPLALVSWVIHFTLHGQSVNSFDGLLSSPSSSSGLSSGLGENWKTIVVMVDTIFTEIESLCIIPSAASEDAIGTGAIQPLAYVGVIHKSFMLFNTMYSHMTAGVGGTAATSSLQQQNPYLSAWDLAKTEFRMATAGILLLKPDPDPANNKAKLKMILMINAIETFLNMALSAVTGTLADPMPGNNNLDYPSNSPGETLAIFGEIIAECRDYVSFAYSYFKPESTAYFEEVIGLDLILPLAKALKLAAPPTPPPTTPFPTQAPTSTPTPAPTTTPSPTERPTNKPTTNRPTERPSPSPTNRPTLHPTASPTPPPANLTCGCPWSCTPTVLGHTIQVAGYGQMTCGTYMEQVQQQFPKLIHNQTEACQAVAYEFSTQCGACNPQTYPCDKTAPHR